MPPQTLKYTNQATMLCDPRSSEVAEAGPAPNSSQLHVPIERLDDRKVCRTAYVLSRSRSPYIPVPYYLQLLSL